MVGEVESTSSDVRCCAVSVTLLFLFVQASGISISRRSGLGNPGWYVCKLERNDKFVTLPYGTALGKNPNDALALRARSNT